MKLSKEALKQVVDSLRKARSKIYDVDPTSLVDYVKLKSNLIRQGYFITDEMLDLPVEQIVELLYKQGNLHVEDNTPEADSEILDKLLEVDMSTFDRERSMMRQGLLSSKTQVEIVQTGKQFTVSWGSTMQRCRISVPVDWEITMSQSLLLSLYDKLFKDHIDPISLDQTFHYVTAMANKLKDYALVRQAITLDKLAGNKINYTSVSQTNFTRLREKGLKPDAALVLTTLIDNYRLNRMKKDFILTTIVSDKPHRTRIRRLAERFL